MTLTAIFFVQQGSKTISWQTERTLHLHWSTLVSYLKTFLDWRFLICSTNVGVFSVVSNMNSTKSRQLCGTFLESKEVFFVLYSYIGMMYSYFLVCMSLSNLPTCVVHQIFTTITQSICPYRILLLRTTACTDGQASRVYFVGDLIILRFPWLRVIIFRLRAVIVFSIVVIVFVL